MPKKITLLEKELKMLEALKAPSVSTKQLLARKLGISAPTMNVWLSGSVEAQSKLSENRKAAHREKIKGIVAKTDAIIAEGVAAYRAAAIAGVAYDTYVIYKQELAGQTC